MGNFEREAELEDALREAGEEPVAATMRLLDDIRRELVQPVPSTAGDQHVAAMMVAVAARRPVVVDDREPCRHVIRPRSRGRHWSRRAGVFSACLGLTFAYGGLATAGALPDVQAVAAHVGSWLGVGVGTTSPRRPTARKSVPGPTNAGPPLSVPATPDGRAPTPGPAVGPRYEGRAGTPAATAPGTPAAPSAPTRTPRTPTPDNESTTNPSTTTHGNSSNAPGQTSRGQNTDAPGHTTLPGRTTRGQSADGSGHTTTTTSHTLASGNAADHAQTSNGANNAG